jgi:hypothetical protein
MWLRPTGAEGYRSSGLSSSRWSAPSTAKRQQRFPRLYRSRRRRVLPLAAGDDLERAIGQGALQLRSGLPRS